MFSCEVNPQYARDYVRVAGWTQGSAEVKAGKHTVGSELAKHPGLVLALNLEETIHDYSLGLYF